MKRTRIKPPVKKEALKTHHVSDAFQGKPLLRMYSELLSRVSMAAQLGVDTYGGDRDVYQALGYPTTLSYKQYLARYKRHDIAKAIIDRPVKASWKGNINVIETVKEGETPFEKKWKEISEELQLKSIFIRADKLTGIGRYSILFLGLNDVVNLEGLRNPVRKNGSLKLLYVKPFSETTAEVSTFEEDPKNPRYGLPKIYDINITSGSKNQTVKVHYTRIVHLVEDLLEDEVYGTPRLQAVYNRLIDLEKLIGGDAEMFWRGARPGYQGIVDKDYVMGDDEFDELKEQVDEFENNLRRILINQGVTYEALDQQIANPIDHVDVQIQMISAVTGIPKRILTGSERGELSSAQDKQEWIAYVTSRREEQNEPMILRPFIDQCVEIGVLPKPANPYMIVWDKLFSLSDKEKVEMGEIRSEATERYVNSAAFELIPEEIFIKYFLNFDELQTEEIMEAIAKRQKESEPILTKDESDMISEEGGNQSSEDNFEE